jgi:6-phospho-beta-glucosidase
VVKKVEADLIDLYKNPNLSEKSAQLEKTRRGLLFGSCGQLDYISIYNNEKDIQTVNVRNNGMISCHPDDVSIEINSVIDADGAHPLQVTTPIQPQIRGLPQLVKAYEELTVQAAINGDYDAALQALTIHPLVGTAKWQRMFFTIFLLKIRNICLSSVHNL